MPETPCGAGAFPGCAPDEGRGVDDVGCDRDGDDRGTDMDTGTGGGTAIRDSSRPWRRQEVRTGSITKKFVRHFVVVNKSQKRRDMGVRKQHATGKATTHEVSEQRGRESG